MTHGMSTSWILEETTSFSTETTASFMMKCVCRTIGCKEDQPPAMLVTGDAEWRA